MFPCDAHPNGANLQGTSKAKVPVDQHNYIEPFSSYRNKSIQTLLAYTILQLPFSDIAALVTLSTFPIPCL